MTKPSILIMCGLPASGKTTRAKEWVAEDPDHRVRINYDDLRIELYGKDWKFNRVEEEAMKEVALDRAAKALDEGKSIVIDNTNLTPWVRQKWITFAASYGIVAEVWEAPTDIWECIERDSKREGKARVGRAVIERMALFNGFIDWNDKEIYNPDCRFVIFDIDGTLADTSHRAHYMQQKPKNWKSFFDECHLDPVKEPIKYLLEDFQSLDYVIIIVSGRPIDSCGVKTEDWLKENDLHPIHLFMRQGGDHRSDVIVKQEILDLLPKDRIAYVLDDRDVVVEMWRRNGLTCLQVAKGDF